MVKVNKTKKIQELWLAAKKLEKHQDDSDSSRKLFQVYAQAANLGAIQAQTQLAWAYDRGIGVSRNPKKAKYWYRKAAQKGEPEAAYNLSQILFANSPKRNREAERFLKIAAKSGLPHAITNLGARYQDAGQMEKAIHYHRLAHAKKEALGTFNLARCYWFGNGVRVNKALAQRLFASAVPRLKSKPHPDSGELSSLWSAYCIGWGIRKNAKIAKRFANRARRARVQERR